MRLRTILLATLPLFLGVGCSVLPNNGTPRTSPVACDYEGKTYRIGEARSAGDTCNACTCGGNGWTCTTNVCPKSDGAELGTIRGTLSYPSEHMPSLRVCAEKFLTDKEFCTQTDDEAYEFELSVPPGEYWVRATRLGVENVKAYYSQAVDCGLGAECLDHSPIRVKVESDASVEADPQDWGVRTEVTEMTVTPSKHIDNSYYYLPGAVFNIETRGAKEVELVYVPFLTWLAERADRPFSPLGMAEPVSQEGEKQRWKFAVPEGFDAGRVWAVAKGEDGSVFSGTGLGWVRSDALNE